MSSRCCSSMCVNLQISLPPSHWSPVLIVRISSHVPRVRIFIMPCADLLIAPLNSYLYAVSNLSFSRSLPRACTSTYGIQTDMHMALAPSYAFLCLTFHPRAVPRDVRRRSNAYGMVYTRLAELSLVRSGIRVLKKMQFLLWAGAAMDFKWICW